MPELPDVTVYLEALSARVKGQKLLGVRVADANWIAGDREVFALTVA